MWQLREGSRRIQGGTVEEQSERELYALEELVYGDLVDAVRLSPAPDEVKGRWMDAVIEALLQAQEAAAAGAQMDAARDALAALARDVARFPPASRGK